VPGPVLFFRKVAVPVMGERNQSRILMTVTAAVTLAVAACGGGGDAGAPPPPSTASKSWKPAQEVPLTSPTANADDPAIALDSAGNAVAVWIEREAAAVNLASRRYAAAGGWEAGRLVESRTGPAAAPQVAIDSAGHAVTVWAQFLDDRQAVAVKRQTSAGAWEATVLMDSAPGSTVSEPCIAVGAAGSAIASWSQTDGAFSHPIFSHFGSNGSWSPPVTLPGNSAAMLSSPRIGFRPDGSALAVWSQLNPVDARSWSSQYRASTGWGAAQLTGLGGPATRPRLAVDPQGNALAVWLQFDGTRTSVRASRAPAGGTWGTAEWIESNDAGDANAPAVAFDGQGNAWAVWTQSDGSRPRVWGARFTANGVWAPAQLIESSDVGSASNALLAVDTAGNALVVWQQHDGRHNNIWASRYTPASGWGRTQAIETYDADHAREPALAMDAAGNAQVIWRQQEGGRHTLWSARFD
jgi:hypothetical protein